VALPEPLLRFLTQVSWALRLQSYGPASGLAMVRWSWVASIAKLTRETGFRPRYTSREALKASLLVRGR
jgi:nucleoside-diphosphate-sugar epimerase